MAASGGGVLVRVDADTHRVSVPGVQPLVYHCRVVPAPGTQRRVSAIVFDVCCLNHREALSIDPLPGHVAADGMVAIPAFGLGSEPLHVVVFSDDGAPGCYVAEAVCVRQRPFAGETMDLNGVARLYVLRVETLEPQACDTLSLCAVAERCHLELAPVEAEVAAVDPSSVPRTVPCAAFHVHGPRPLESAEGVRALLEDWTRYLDSACANVDLREAIRALLPRAAVLAEPFIARVGVSLTLEDGTVPPPPARASAGRCMISQADALKLGEPGWSLCLVKGKRSEGGDYFVYVCKSPLVVLVDTRRPARFPVALSGSELPPAWLSRHDTELYRRACAWYRAARFQCSVASISASLEASAR